MRTLKECALPDCPNCRQVTQVVATGRHERRLFPWQQRRGGPGGKHGPIFTAAKDGHDEAEARCLSCGQTFWSMAPVLVEDAKAQQVKEA